MHNNDAMLTYFIGDVYKRPPHARHPCNCTNARQISKQSRFARDPDQASSVTAIIGLGAAPAPGFILK
jgi:hypothetical protein